MASYMGKICCKCQALWLPVYQRMLHFRGVLPEDKRLHIYQLIGGAPQSGGTHVNGGASDLVDLPGEEDLVIARQMGADASWVREENWDGKGGIRHYHGVLTGCKHNGTAQYQIDAVRDGYNGLGYLGRGGPDDGPRPLSGRTWQEGIEWAEEQMSLRGQWEFFPEEFSF